MSTITPEITTDTHVFFYSKGTIYSNWHRTPCQFKDPLNGDITFDSSEQAFMWWKAVFHQDLRIASLIEKETNPAQVKAWGREIKGYNDKAWECVRLGYMQYVCLLKFQQNPKWAEQLKATGDRILVEASPVDEVWGVGLDVQEAASAADLYMSRNGYDIPEQIPWTGRNLLGQALMTVRGLL